MQIMEKIDELRRELIQLLLSHATILPHVMFVGQLFVRFIIIC